MMLGPEEVSRSAESGSDPPFGAHPPAPLLRLAGSPADLQDGVFTTREAAGLLKCNVRSLRRAIERGELAAVKRGSVYYIEATELMRYATRSLAPPVTRPQARLLSFPAPHARSPSLPQRLSPFVGRAADVAAVVARLQEPAVRLLTLTGPGGIGKTRLALEVAEAARDQFPDGVVCVELAPVSRPDLVLPAICRELGVREVADRDPRAHLYAHLRAKRMLLVIDNVEHVLEAAPDIAAIAAHAAGVTVLATSRAPLRVAGEYEYAVAPLRLPAEPVTAASLVASDAARLFVTRAHAHDPAFQIGEDSAPVIAGICGRLDGLPLGIELAAARVKLLSLDQIHSELERRLPLLAGGNRDAPRRHRTMRDAIAWSYDLLSPAEQRLFRQLAVFAGGFALDAADRVRHLAATESSTRQGAGGDAGSSSTLDLVAALLDQSLIVRETIAGGPPRYRMLATIREYGLERLSAAEAEATRAAHARYFLAMAQDLRPLVTTEATRVPLDRLADDDANLRGALAWLDEHGPAPDFVSLVAALCCYWCAFSLAPESRPWVTRALGKRGAATRQDRAILMIGCAELFMLTGEDAQAEAAFAEGLPLLRELGNPFDLANGLLVHGAFLNYQGNFVAAQASLNDALALAVEIDDAVLNAAITGAAYANLSDSARGRGDLALATTQGEAALHCHAGWHLDLADIRVLMDLAGIAKDQGDYRLAVERYMAGLERMGNAGDRRLVADALSGIATAATVWHAYRPALLLFAAASELRERLGIAMSLPGDVATTELSLGTLRTALGPNAFATTWTEGRALSQEAAITVAGTVTPPPVTRQAERVSGASPLTAREKEVLRLVADGRTDRDIAEALFIGRRTVSWHVSAILEKLDVASRRDAVAVSRDAGFI
jgi:excisionase family DNA binding protein